MHCWGYDTFEDWHSGTEVAAGIEKLGGAECGIRSDGTFTCWGYTDSISVFGWPDPTANFSAISTSSLHLCGLNLEGNLECWGRDTPEEEPDAVRP